VAPPSTARATAPHAESANPLVAGSTINAASSRWRSTRYSDTMRGTIPCAASAATARLVDAAPRPRGEKASADGTTTATRGSRGPSNSGRVRATNPAYRRSTSCSGL
jgi:hypothetical protein